MSFDMDLYLYMSWIDPKMAHNEPDYILINDKKVLDRMWLPDLYFANAKTSHFHEVTVPNFNMYVNNAGVISYGTRVTLNVACNLNLKNYPLDQQLCYVKIISYAYTTNEMNVTWFDGISINYNSEIGLPELRIVSIKPDYCDGTYTYTLTQNSSRVGKNRSLFK
uniref:Neurotransmitter-gated ion-channel ligand-binding domain-containing protein n=1 Tax=Acrobeloides nanus TaxID=290746 RepID=A0A914CJ92_9BILA